MFQSSDVVSPVVLEDSWSTTRMSGRGYCQLTVEDGVRSRGQQG
jgi:hypothetical protein